MTKFNRSDSVGLFEKRPELRKLWSKKNDPSIKPELITSGLAQEFFWDCPKGHTFSAAPSKLSEGRGCNYCSGKRVLEGFNDLGCTDPNKASFFNEKKNGFSAHEIVFGSTKQGIWWVCPSGHEWQQDLRGFKAKSGCPVCKGRIAVRGANDLATSHPNLANQLRKNYTDEQIAEVLPNSTKKLKWNCENSHEWEAPVRDRVAGASCPYCLNKFVWKGYNDFSSVHPELVAEWDEGKNSKSPDEVVAGSGYKAHWKCALGHEWQTPVHRRSDGRGCLYCANREVWAGFNDLRTRFPEVASEWDMKRNKIGPEDVLFGTNEKYFWNCPSGHSYVSQVSKRTLEGTGCPVCRGFLVVEGVNDLGSQRPALAKRWSSSNTEKPKDVFYNSRSKNYIFLCSQGHEYKTSPGNAGDDYCPTCANKELAVGFNDLQTVSPTLAEEFMSMGSVKNPTLVPSWTMKSAEWKCSLGHTWKAAVRTRLQGTDCPYCGNKSVSEGFNDLKTTHPQIAEEWDLVRNKPKTPAQVIAGSPQKFWWVCKKGHSYEQSLSNRTHRNYNCPVCVNRKLLIGFNDLETRFPELALEWHPTKNSLAPREVIFGSYKPYWWKCDKGHEWQATPSTRIRGVGCQSCNKGGFNPSAPSFVYFIRHPQLKARKVGIRNSTSSRLRNFNILGWELIEEFFFEDGTEARIVEKHFFLWLRRELSYPQFLTNEDMEPFAGATETFSGEELEDLVFSKKLRELRKGLGSL